MYSYKKIILQPLLLTSFLLILAMGWVFFTMIQLIDSLEKKEIIDLKVYHVLELNNALSGIQNNQLNYTLTQNLMYLTAYKASVEKAKIHFEKIRQLNYIVNSLKPILDQVEAQLIASFQYKSNLLDKEAGTYSPHLASQIDEQAHVIDIVKSELYTVDQLLFKQRQLLHKKIKGEIKTTIISGIFLIVSVFIVLIYSYKKTTALFKSVAEKETVVNSLSFQAQHDPLTGLLNRRGFELALERVYFNARQASRQFALIYIDLDGFKLINDHFGHEVGDQLLIKVGKLFSGVLREGDHIARLGGDEFALIIEQFKYQEELSQLAMRLIATLDHPVLIDGESTDVGASVGVASYPKHAKNVQALIVEADNAMYQAKKSGKNRHCFAQAA
jgi:diguanylate cyclase